LDGVGIINIETQNTRLLLKTVDKLVDGNRNSWGGLGAVLVHARTSRVTDGLLDPVPGPPRHLPGITGVNLSDGVATSFWLNAWSTLGALAAALPALFSPCTDPHIMVAAVFRSGVLALPLQSRLSSVGSWRP
jgi:hypothetical protein